MKEEIAESTTKACLYCGAKENLVTDHIVPRSRGGKEIKENLFDACISCNCSKSNKLPSEWRHGLSPLVYELEKRSMRLHPRIKPIVDFKKGNLQKLVNNAEKMHARASLRLEKAKSDEKMWRKKMESYRRRIRDLESTPPERTQKNAIDLLHSPMTALEFSDRFWPHRVDRSEGNRAKAGHAFLSDLVIKGIVRKIEGSTPSQNLFMASS